MPGDRLLRQMRKPSASPLFLTSVYLAAGLAWIFFSDLIVESLPGPVAAILQTVKGTLFVLVTGLVLFVLLSRRQRTLTRSAQALRDSEKEHRAVVEAAAEGIATLDLAGHATFMNPRLREILALTGMEETVLLERVDDEGRAAAVEAFRQALRGSCRRITARLATTEGRLVPCELAMAPMPGHDGGVRGAVVMVSELTERIAVERERDRARAQLEESERLAALGRLAAKLAHEFNNVLMGILPFVEVIRRLSGDERIESASANIVRSVERGKAITHDLLGFTRLAKPETRRIPLEGWLSRVVDEIRAGAGNRASVVLQQHGEPLTVAADPEQLRQALLNLAEEACEALPAGGKLTIEARPAAEQDGLTDPSSFVSISIADDGPGIPADVLPHLFEPLYARGKNGRGLALPLAHQIVANNGGRMSVESSGGGSTFRLLVPRG